MICWVEDCAALLEVLTMAFGEFGIKTYASWSEVPVLKSGDLVFHDYDGVGEKPVPVEGVTYYCCSGNPLAKADFVKPNVPIEEISEIMRAHLAR